MTTRLAAVVRAIERLNEVVGRTVSWLTLALVFTTCIAAEGLWAVAERQCMFSDPDEGYAEVFLKPDLAPRRVRKIMSDLLRDEQRSAQQAAE